MEKLKESFPFVDLKGAFGYHKKFAPQMEMTYSFSLQSIYEIAKQADRRSKLFQTSELILNMYCMALKMWNSLGLFIPQNDCIVVHCILCTTNSCYHHGELAKVQKT